MPLAEPRKVLVSTSERHASEAQAPVPDPSSLICYVPERTFAGLAVGREFVALRALAGVAAVSVDAAPAATERRVPGALVDICDQREQLMRQKGQICTEF